MSEQPSATASRDIWTVSRLNLEVRALLESGFGHVWIEGEISNFAHPRSGHMYFSLKDSSCQVRCAMFRGQNRKLQFVPASGQQVLLRGRVGLYAERGDYQLIADYMEEGGIGALRRAFDALKARLGAEGLFESERKQHLPSIPRQVGVLSSATGAAIHDILTTLKRRFPSLPVVIYPIPVQGPEAPAAIVAALKLATARNECDVLVIARGGGSLEDLWAFNDEEVARAIAACPIPTISGVGHEVDFTISDFVADQRAATPTAAAEAISPDGEALALKVGGWWHRLVRTTLERIHTRQQILAQITKRLTHPATRLQELNQRSDLLTIRLQRAWFDRLAAQSQALTRNAQALQRFHPARRIENYRLRHQQARQRLLQAGQTFFNERQLRLASLARALRAVGPAATLARGYAIVTDSTGTRILRRSADTSTGATVDIRLGTGALQCTVDKVLEP